MENIQNLTQLMQSLISPIVLISGVGLLLLSFTNRLGRVIDRSRFLIKEKESGHEIENLPVQLKILYKRARLLRAAISCIVITMFMAGLMILILFLAYFSIMCIKTMFIFFFIIAIIFLIVAVLLFLTDVTLGLKALKLQLKGYFKSEI